MTITPETPERQMTTGDMMEYLYRHEINSSISTFWDGGFHVRLGDEHNGWLEEIMMADLSGAPRWLLGAAKKHFPNCEWEPLNG